MSFGDDANLCRATKLAQVMGNAASIFGSSAGTASTYALSAPTKTIDFFISHNWSVGRFHKYLALCFYFNIRSATLGTVLLLAPFIFLSGIGVLPTAQLWWHSYPQGVVWRCFSVLLFIVLLLLSGDVKKGLGIAGPRVFLDKTCIHQTDKVIQRQGIGKLGAFLSRSQHMVALYADGMYLSKLWTVYEFACFLTLHPVSHMTLIPLVMSVTCFKGLLLVAVLNPTVTLLEVYTGFYWSHELSYVVVVPLILWALRIEAREKQSLRAKADDFSVRKCICACEDDRPIVYDNIAKLMRAARVVSSRASEEEALDAFDEMARGKLPGLVGAATGKNTCRYSELVMYTSALVMPFYMDSLVGAFHGMTLYEGLLEAAMRLTLNFAIAPVSFGLFARLASKCLGLSGLREGLYVALISYLGLFLAEIRWIILRDCLDLFGTAEEKAGLWLAVVLMVTEVLVALWMFGACEKIAHCLPLTKTRAVQSAHRFTDAVRMLKEESLNSKSTSSTLVFGQRSTGSSIVGFCSTDTHVGFRSTDSTVAGVRSSIAFTPSITGHISEGVNPTRGALHPDFFDPALWEHSSLNGDSCEVHALPTGSVSRV